MAFFFTTRLLFLFVIMLSFAVFFCKSEDEWGGDPGQIADPAQIVAKALLCFNDKYIYSSCEESYRLTKSGNINVPHEATDQFCSGPCLTESNLVLNCLNNILSNFLFYNRATIQDVRETLRAGCSYSSDRGNFNVLEHMGEYNHASKFTISIYMNVFMILALILFYHY